MANAIQRRVPGQQTRSVDRVAQIRAGAEQRNRERIDENRRLKQEAIRNRQNNARAVTVGTFETESERRQRVGRVNTSLRAEARAVQRGSVAGNLGLQRTLVPEGSIESGRTDLNTFNRSVKSAAQSAAFFDDQLNRTTPGATR